MTGDEKKRAAAEAAMEYVGDDMVVGVGTGSTVNHFIECLAGAKHRIEGAVASSSATAERLRGHGIPVLDLNQVDEVPVYIDGADEATRHLQLIKGGGGALTREKMNLELLRIWQEARKTILFVTHVFGLTASIQATYATQISGWSERHYAAWEQDLWTAIDYSYRLAGMFAIAFALWWFTWQES